MLRSFLPERLKLVLPTPQEISSQLPIFWPKEQRMQEETHETKENKQSQDIHQCFVGFKADHNAIVNCKHHACIAACPYCTATAPACGGHLPLSFNRVQTSTVQKDQHDLI